tara:strand:+ start:2373 stop:3914 length:1542 start_codon:yes stop_codon:yes gene_type:complete
MIVAGIGMGHLPSVTLMKDGKIIYYNEERKLSRLKHIGGIPFRCLDQIKNLGFKIDKAYSTSYNKEILETNNLINYLHFKGLYDKDLVTLDQPHHLSHAIKAFIDSGFKEARVFVIDGRGSFWDGVGHEVCSIFDLTRDVILCLYKQIWKFNWSNKKPKESLGIAHDTEFNITNKVHLGEFYAKISEKFGFKDEEGKFMGYQSAGKVDYALLESIPKFLTYEGIKKLPQTLDAAKTYQTFFEVEIRKLVSEYENPNMVFTGGSFLNVINNYKLSTKFKNSQLYFEPLCGDEGNSIGIAYFHYLTKQKSIQPLKHIYIGQKIKTKPELLQNERLIDRSIEHIVHLLHNGHVVGLVQGKAEAGPRALGNRSLLLDPTIPTAKDIMNEIKKREKFRPFAVSVLQEKFSEFFDGNNYIPTMMMAPSATDKLKKIAPAVVHVDNTCRVQTVNQSDNYVLYELLKQFKVPLLMNTSFNLAGYPIDETFEDILFTFRNSKLSYVYFADEQKLLIKNDTSA